MTGQTIQFTLGGTLKFSVEEPSAGDVFFELTYDRFTIKAKGDGMAYVLPNDHAVKVKVAYVDSRGNPAPVDGPVVWQSSDVAIAKVQVDVDTTTAIIVPTDQIGQVQVSVIADADLGTGVKTLITTMDIEVVGGQAVAGTIAPVGEATPIVPEPRK